MTSRRVSATSLAVAIVFRTGAAWADEPANTVRDREEKTAQEQERASEDVLLVTTEGEPAWLDPLKPPTLPSLTHADAALELDYTGAGIGQGSLGQTLVWMAYLEGEVPLTTRAWHAGLAWDVVSAAAEGRGRALVYGNPEVWVRGVGWHESGLTAGGSLGVVIPLPRAQDDEARACTPNEEDVFVDAGGAPCVPEPTVLDAIRVIRPWDSGYFESNIVTLRPSFDARLVFEPVVLQIRQGLDWSYAFDTGRADILARTGTYVGVSPVRQLTVALELWNTYSITKPVTDNQRAAFTLSPSIRARFGPVEPGLSVLFPISTPLEGIAEEYLAVRAHVRLALGETAAVK